MALGEEYSKLIPVAIKVIVKVFSVRVFILATFKQLRLVVHY